MFFVQNIKHLEEKKMLVMDLNLHVLTRATLSYMYILLITENCKPCQW